MITIEQDIYNQISGEGNFELFKSSDLTCCVLRMARGGNLNGYVGVNEKHPLYGKSYSDKIVVSKEKELQFNGNYIGLLCNDIDEVEAGLYSLDIAINVHGGLTYSEDSLKGLDEAITGKLWWFGFDTSHAWDISPYQTEIDRKFSFGDTDKEYRNFDYV